MQRCLRALAAVAVVFPVWVAVVVAVPLGLFLVALALAAVEAQVGWVAAVLVGLVVLAVVARLIS